jgi:hypothetical protein
MPNNRGVPLVLAYADALKAIDEHAAEGRRIENWEGWVKFPTGMKAKSLAHSGTFALSRDPARAAATAKSGIERANQHWARDPEYPGAELWFGLTFAEPEPTPPTSSI